MYRPRYLDKTKKERSVNKFKEELMKIRNKPATTLEVDYSDYGFYWDCEHRKFIINGKEEEDVTGAELTLKAGEAITVKLSKLIKKDKMAIINGEVKIIETEEPHEKDIVAITIDGKELATNLDSEMKKHLERATISGASFTCPYPDCNPHSPSSNGDISKAVIR